MNQFYISAAHKSSGKTIVSIGVSRALVRRGLRVAPFKKGPDYIDPIWLSQSSAHACWNLDFFTMDHQEIRACFADQSLDSDVALVEGNKGLYDGLDVEGSDSNAALAKLLALPVVLVIDVTGITRGIAPLLAGYAGFDPDINLAGVILNKVAGSRQESKLRAAVERYTDLPVIGAIGREPALRISERHLGLVPGNEHAGAVQTVDEIANVIEQSVDLDRLLALTETTHQENPVTPAQGSSVAVSRRPGTDRRVKIAIARDEAFGFYYPDDLAAFAKAGAELVPFSTLVDGSLPKVDGLFIGGGFPECFIGNLSANATLRDEIKTFIEAGGPSYAECGGLMYLSRSLTWQGISGEMVGVLPGDTEVLPKPVGRGYMQIRVGTNHPWPRTRAQAGDVLNVHEFHHSRFNATTNDWPHVFSVERGHGLDGVRDGIHVHNLLATYAHQRHVQSNSWVDAFVDFVRTHRP